MEQIKTSTGFEIELEEDVFDDMELLENLALVDRGDMSALPLALDLLLGDDKQRLYDHCRGTNGRASAKKVMAEVGEILKNVSSVGKN